VNTTNTLNETGKPFFSRGSLEFLGKSNPCTLFLHSNLTVSKICVVTQAVFLHFIYNNEHSKKPENSRRIQKIISQKSSNKFLKIPKTRKQKRDRHTIKIISKIKHKMNPHKFHQIPRKLLKR